MKQQKMQEKKKAAEQKKRTQAARGMASKVVSSGLETKRLLEKQMQDPDLWMLPTVIVKRAEKALKDLSDNIETTQQKFEDDAPARYPEEFVSQWPTTLASFKGTVVLFDGLLKAVRK